MDIVDIADLDPDPFVQFAAWYAEFVATEPREPGAVVLATAGEAGRPSARHVLLKGFDENGFVFFTNYESRKGRELAANPHACLLFGWLSIARQVTVTGVAERVSAATSDDYFASRDRGSQLAAWASDQSRPLADRRALELRYEALAAEYEGRPVPRPPHWGGFRVAPETIEFWQSRPNRLHDRFCYERLPSGWAIVRLNP